MALLFRVLLPLELYLEHLHGACMCVQVRVHVPEDGLVTSPAPSTLDAGTLTGM